MRVTASPRTARALLRALLLSGLAGCSGGGAGFEAPPPPPPLSEAPPSLRAAETALAGGAASVALSITDGIVRREPRNAAALVRQGDAHAVLGQPDAAAESYRRALAVDPGRVEAKLGLARLLLSADPAGAETLLREVVAAQPAQAAALNDIGIARDRLGRHAEAQADYRAAIAAEPQMTAAMTNLALSLALTGRAEEAVSMLRPLAAQPAATPRVRQDFAAALALNGRQAEAEQVLRRDLSGADARQLAADFGALAPPAEPAAAVTDPVAVSSGAAPSASAQP